ncbi:hybrid sensor histidine kinase/response regulator [Pseudomonas sp. S60]|uniref:hybrid sensor histidine kinase/response regulator n=1 Tax=Pseudomonas sp. S60 TaxID=211124 RepID=UPI0019136429|nr:ATP-binding protein [Pseudomonas sp. S60]
MIVVAKDKPRAAAANPVQQAQRAAAAALAQVSITQFDWSRTSLGPLPRWSASLRIAVDMAHLSPFPCAVVWGPDMTVVPNNGYCALRPTVDAQGKAFDAVWAEVWDAVGPWVFDVLNGRSSFVEDPPVRINCGECAEQTWCTFGYTPLHDERGEVAGFLHTVVETTASIEARDHWRRLAEGFERDIQRHAAEREQIWQLSHDAMMTLTPDLKLHGANPTWFRILGWAQEHVQGMPILELVHPADRAEVQLAVDGLLQHRHADQVETRLRHCDGHYHWFTWRARFEAGLMTVVGQDITEHHELAMRQSEALLRNNERMEVVGQLAGGMGNEMNNLLAGIGGSLELLQSRLNERRLERVDDYVRVARDSVQRAMELTHRLLAFSRERPLAPKPIYFNRQLRQSEPLLASTLGAEIGLKWQLDVAPWAVNVDVPQFENALINLCANAREACLGRGSVTVRTVNERLTAWLPDETGVPPGDYVALHIEDTGHGMPARDVARAFEPFFTTKPMGRGSGLGLSMVYGFVRQSGGYAWIESSVNEGTKVCMLFPRSLHAIAQEQPHLGRSVSRASGERVLLVDDELNLRAVMREYLTERGFDVTDVPDANTALERFHQGDVFDLVITDIGLPGGFSGRQVAKAIRMELPQQKILFITGYAQQQVEPEFLEQPGTALMNKPFMLAELADKALGMLDT